MNYPYNYMQDLQNMRDRIDNQMRQLAQPQPITQNFQISNIGDLEGRYANDINEVKNTFWYYDEDIQNTEEAKLYNYYKYIVK